MQTNVDQLAKLLKTAADPVRLNIIHLLGMSSYGALELSYILGLKQNSLSHHLKLLSQSGLIESRREGNSIYYRRAIYSGHSQVLVAEIVRQSDQIVLSHLQSQNMLMVKQERELQSKEFFSKNALRFKEQQELIADYESYGDVAQKLLTTRCEQFNHAIEIGSGTGEFLQHLSRSFNQVTAVDISKDMLDQAIHFCEQNNLNNVDLQLGDQSLLADNYSQSDAVVFNMVLHHVSNPADEIKKATNLLKTKGMLLVTELCSHDQDWARSSCGDLWLGFDEKELKQWAFNCGLLPVQTTHVGLRNGFQIQCQLFVKSADIREV